MGLLIGLVIGLIIAITPAILIIFSKLISGKTKALWFIGVLIIPYLLKIIATAFVIVLQGNALPYGLGPVIPLTWYISAWAMYFLFIRRYGKNKENINS